MITLPKINEDMIRALYGTDLIEVTLQGAFVWTQTAVDLIPFLSSTEQQGIETLQDKVSALELQIDADCVDLEFHNQEIESLCGKLKDAQSLYREYQIETSKQKKEIETLRSQVEILRITCDAHIAEIEYEQGEHYEWKQRTDLLAKWLMTGSCEHTQESDDDNWWDEFVRLNPEAANWFKEDKHDE